jgi:hypothetical protein
MAIGNGKTGCAICNAKISYFLDVLAKFAKASRTHDYSRIKIREAKHDRGYQTKGPP